MTTRMINQRRPKKGTITPNGVILELHEYATVTTLTEAGYDVELIPPSHTPNSKTGDLMMLGMIWEMKAPVGKSRSTLEHIIQKAIKQSPNIIIDLRRTKLDDAQAMNSLRKLHHKFRSIRKLLVIDKNARLIVIEK